MTVPLQRELTSAHETWRLLRCAADALADPAELPSLDHSDWIHARVPGTAAQSLQARGDWSWDCPVDFDADDWWYACEFDAVSDEPGDRLCFEGLATLCEIWLNGERLGETGNMFLPVEFDLDGRLQPRNRLLLRFRSLNRALDERRPRPAWKTRLVSHQNLRWMRTTLLGRIPGWSPPVAPVGPWRGVFLRSARYPRNLQLMPRLDDGRASLDLRFELSTGTAKPSVMLLLDGREWPLTAESTETGWRVDTRLELPGIEPWMPHTHGRPRLHDARLRLAISGQESEIDLPRLGFRSLELDTTDGDFALSVNGVPVFCRGACWTVNDMVSLDGDRQRLRDTLQLMQRAGANMIRIGGTMLYEQDDFYALCDELGILVWQDFMFANMDYPQDDADFMRSVEAEAAAQLQRLSAHACIAVYCGNSEVEQQATMMGLSPAEARNPLFHDFLPRQVAAMHPGVPYVPSTPFSEDERDLPFRTDRGLSHYYGVGAYLRPLSELRSHDVRFTPETLGFANVPPLNQRKALFGNETAVLHHPLWKQRTPRDANAGWDFEDVRDHYLEQLLSLEPARLRYERPEFYWRVSEFITGEIMRRVFAEWRSGHSRCRGALIWFLKDLWPGAGWGIIDSDGQPKSAWHALKRSWQPRGLCITDENLNGLDIHLYNECETEMQGDLKLQVFNHQGARLLEAEQTVAVPGRCTTSLNATELIGRFFDLSYAYRFGPLAHQLVSVEMQTSDGAILRDLYLPENRLPVMVEASVLEAEAKRDDSGAINLWLQAQKLLHAVHVEARGYRCSDNDFHLAPGQGIELLLEPIGEIPKRFSCTVEALNLEEAQRVRLSE